MLERVKKTLSILIVLMGFIYSNLIALHSMNSEEFIEVDELLKHSNRDIAALKKNDLGLGVYTDHLLISTSPLKALSQAKLIKTDKFIQLTLGHFSTKNKRGEAAFACQVYDKVMITYEAINEGMKTPPQSMILEISCKIAENDILHLMPINLAPGQILKEQPGDGVFQFTEKGEFSVRFQNVEDQWPRQWVLKSVQFKDSQNQSPIKEVSTLDLPTHSLQDLNMDWSRFN